MRKPISKADKEKLHEFERRLKSAAKHGQIPAAEEALKDICRIFGQHSDHPRLLEAKLWYFECLLDSNHAVSAESGFIGIRRKANPNTRLQLEATFLEGISLLRQKKALQAKELFRSVLLNLKKIQSDKSRRLLEKRIIERIEEEAIICELIGVYEGELTPERIHEKAVALIQTKSEDEIFELMGSCLPNRAVQLLLDLRGDAILQLPDSDRKYLPPQNHASQPLNLGKRAAAFLKRIGWRTLCDVESPIYQLWSSKVPEIYSAGFFAKALCDSFTNWSIQIPTLAGGVVAIAMKYSAQDFCEWAKPSSIMEVRRKKEE